MEPEHLRRFAIESLRSAVASADSALPGDPTCAELRGKLRAFDPVAGSPDDAGQIATLAALLALKTKPFADQLTRAKGEKAYAPLRARLEAARALTAAGLQFSKAFATDSTA